MAETKRVSDQYKISAPAVVIDGNLTVLGSTTTVESTNSTIKDNTIVLNYGETGAGVSTLGTLAGIEIDRGSLTNVTLRWNESTDKWELSNDGVSYYEIITTGSGVASAAGIEGSVQYNSSGSLGGEASFIYDSALNILYIDSTAISGNDITVTDTNGDLTISANGTGSVKFDSATSLLQLGSAPSAVPGRTALYASSPGAGYSGLSFVNSTGSDELISRRRALMMALIM